MDTIYDVMILGAGPAGLTAALYAGRSGLNTLLLEQGQDGGQIALTDEIENYPGQLEGESGAALIARMSAQAVGGAVGHNKISIIIPCHRVVGTNGSLTGYAGGIHKKEQLLELERADMSRFFLPKKGTAL